MTWGTHEKGKHMAFEVYTASVSRSYQQPPGTCRANGQGDIRFNPQDLEDAGIEHEAVLLIDVKNRSIALRAVHGNDVAGRIMIYRKRGVLRATSPFIRIVGALRLLQGPGGELCDFKGTHNAVRSGDMLVVAFGPAEAESPAAPLNRDNPLRLETAKPAAKAGPAVDTSEPVWNKKARRKNG